MISNLKINDFLFINELSHHTSLRSLGRKLKMEPQNISKLLKRIETEVGYEIIRTSPKGYFITSEGEKILITSKNLIRLLNSSEPGMHLKNSDTTYDQASYIFCSRVFLNYCLAADIVTFFEKEFPNVGFNFVDGSPAKKEEWSRAGLTDIVLSVGAVDLGKSWTEFEVGQITWNFYANVNHEIFLNKETKIHDLFSYDVIGHSHIDGKRIIQEKNFIFHGSERKNESQNQTSAETALTFARLSMKTNKISFIPDIVAKAVDANEKFIRAIPIDDYKVKNETIILYVHVDRVQQNHFMLLLSKLKKLLDTKV